MTEKEWLEGDAFSDLVEFFYERASERKLRLFACACVQRMGEILRDDRSKKAIEASLKFADGLIGKKKLAEARRAAYEVTRNREGPRFTSRGVEGDPTEGAEVLAAISALYASTGPLKQEGRGKIIPAHHLPTVWFCLSGPKREASERSQVLKLARHLLGNPFRSPSLRQHLPGEIQKLADSVYAGEDYHFALHDALLDAGHAELAAHFRDPDEWHPKGCWALDVILGKQ